MIRTVKKALVTVATRDQGSMVQKDIVVVANNDKEIKTELNKIFGRGAGNYIIINVQWHETTYELSDKIFFDNAKIIKDTLNA